MVNNLLGSTASNHQYKYVSKPIKEDLERFSALTEPKKGVSHMPGFVYPHATQGLQFLNMTSPALALE